MLCQATQDYIDKKIKEAKEQNILVPNDYISILIKYYEEVIRHHYTLEFSTKGGLTSNNLDGSYCYSKKPWSAISVTPEWAAKLIICGDNETKTAFRITLGHEIAHKEKEIGIFRYGPKHWQLIKFLNEIHADYHGTELMMCGSRQALMTSCQYKKKYKEQEFGEEDSGNLFHPSWAKRLEYATDYDFNSDLIKKVAEDLGYDLSRRRHKQLLDQIITAYKDKYVMLQPRPKPMACKSSGQKKIS